MPLFQAVIEYFTFQAEGDHKMYLQIGAVMQSEEGECYAEDVFNDGIGA